MNKKTTSFLAMGFLYLAGLLLAGCNPGALTDVREDMDGEVWYKEDTLQATFQLKDTTRYLNIALNTRLTPDYPFSNLYVHTVVIAPDGKETESVKTFDVTNKAGKWLGSGLGDLHAYTFPLFPEFAAAKKGTYKVRVVQQMRVDSLRGCHDRGLRVSLGEEIF